MAVAVGDRKHLSGHRLRQTIGELNSIGQQNFGHAADFRRLFGGIRSVMADHQNVHFATGLGRGGHRIQRGRADRLPVMFRKHQRRHQITFASVFSFATKAAASGTLIPALRPGGSVTCSVFNLGVTSTPRSSGFKFSSGFFFAFMMFGKVT